MNTNTDIDNYKKMVNDYYLIGYKWNDILKSVITKSNKQFMKFTKASRNILETIDVEVLYPYFKIINLTVYIFPVNDLTSYNGSYEDNLAMMNYINDNENKKKISKLFIKIIENDKIFTITDNRYNIYKLDDIITSDNEYLHYKCTIQSLISHILLPNTFIN
jgi:hypothetical protein